MDLRIDIGSGPFQIPGFVRWDIKDGALAFPLALQDESVTEIRASHVLEHLSFGEAQAALADWNRALKTGGTLRVAVPDFDKAADDTENPLRLRYVMGGQTDEHDFHKSAWTRDSLTNTLTRIGFDVGEDWVSELKDCASLPVSLNISATKRRPSHARIVAVMNVPRLGWQDHWSCAHNAFHALGIPIHTTQGVFWGQCQTRAFENAIAEGYDWAVCLDYDSVFTPWHVDVLLKMMAERPQIDALCAVQPKRQSESVLFNPLDNATEVKLKVSEPYQVRSAHFGLTVIRLASLERVPRPWFLHVPDPQGSFNDGRVDEDVAFWRKWTEAGLNVSILPGCSIGHLEAKVTFFNITSNKLECMYVNDWKDLHREWGVL